MKRHPLDLFSLAAGLVVSAMGGLWFAGIERITSGELHVRDWWPGAMIVLGSILVIAATRRASGEAEREDGEPREGEDVR